MVVDPPAVLRESVIKHYAGKSDDKVFYDVKGLSAKEAETGAYLVTVNYDYSLADKSKGSGTQMIIAQKGADQNGKPYWVLKPTDKTEPEK